MDEIVLNLLPDGSVKCLWNEEIDLYALGDITTERASSIEFSPTTQQWEVRLMDGRCIGSDPSRAALIQEEIDYLQREMINRG